MRDILLTLIIFGSLPLILRRPVVGAFMWIWVSVMNPHTQGWGYAQHFPFAAVIAVTTMFSLLLWHGPRKLPITAISVTLLALVTWMNITTPFAMFPAPAFEQWNKVMKIMLMTLVTMMLVRSREDVHRLIWVLALSLGYYGIKGGIFTIRSGGTDRVWGPGGSFIADNNAIALALIMIIPLMYYLHQECSRVWLRRGLVGAMLLSALAALGSYSRGGLLAIAAMALFMWGRSGNKIAVGMLLAVLTPLLLLFMPDVWFNRMDTIGEYHLDASALGRINAWHMAWNLASHRPLGGGFEVTDAASFMLYAPEPLDVHAAHSIYFQVLGEHGFVGLALYLLLGLLTWRSAAWTARRAHRVPELKWAASLSRMIQASLIGFGVGGAFLSLLYFDVPYYLMAAVVATRVLVEQHLKTLPSVRPGVGRPPG